MKVDLDQILHLPQISSPTDIVTYTKKVREQAFRMGLIIALRAFAEDVEPAFLLEDKSVYNALMKARKAILDIEITP